MDRFPDGHHVRLRSLLLGTYLHAADDGIGVRLDPDQASVNAAWTVHRYQGEDYAIGHLLLHSAAFGRYLAATDSWAPFGQRGSRLELREFDEPEVGEIMWEARPRKRNNAVLLRHVSDRLLRANGGRLFNWNSGVTVDKIENLSAMNRWVVEPIPPLQAYPGVPNPIAEPLSSRKFMCLPLEREPPPVRVIRFQRANADGTFNEDGWTEFQFRGNSSYLLRLELLVRLDIVDFIMCVRAGRYGRLTPMLANLPSGTGDTLDIVAIHSLSPGADELRYPDMDTAPDMDAAPDIDTEPDVDAETDVDAA
ncbi:uncharacterized protein LOC100822701 [Brachypodium distachyon]|uniref:Uncharacterized protein n=1 Tax=Brachypodium distachyon TaxID=15368 RepID=I1H0S6_BRADI|nr:uncharacterized protein LOC100822701 [Brachypodium distachyon]PNT76470.1 hypothetical protein BRADI_1g48550v3 [Brachypodium distachyon]|eukprot:XP_003561056.1 uncharacterized protein LOC100822701 [Brachypodium distachyon]